MYNILRDIVFTIEPGGLDDGAYGSAAAAVTALLDTFGFSSTTETDDHSTAEELHELHREVKKDFSFNFETKLKHASLRSDIATTGSAGTVLTLYPGGVDDLVYGTGGSVGPTGLPAAAGTAGTGLTSLCFDSITITQTNRLQDHSCATDEYMKHRIKKRSTEFSFETKMQEGSTAGIEYLLKNNALIGFYVPIKPGSAAHAQVLLGGLGIVTGFEFGYDGPNTLRFNMSPYGAGIGVTLGATDTATLEALLLTSTGSAANALTAPGDTTGFGASNELFKFIALNSVGGTGALDVTAIGVVEGITINIKPGPITISASFKSYGTAPTYTVS